MKNSAVTDDYYSMYVCLSCSSVCPSASLPRLLLLAVRKAIKAGGGLGTRLPLSCVVAVL